MSRLITCGYEIREPTNSPNQKDHPDGGYDSLAATTGSIDTSVFRSGLASLKFNSGASAVGGTSLFQENAFTANGVWTFVSGRHYFFRGYYRFPSVAPGGKRCFWRLNDSGNDLLFVLLDTDGTISLWLWNGTGLTQIGSNSSASLIANAWHRVEVRFMIDTGTTNDFAELYLDGVLVASATVNLGNAAPVSIGTGLMTHGSDGSVLDANFVVNIDDVALNDDQGADQNSYPGDCDGIVLLPPVSDSSRAGFTAGAAGTTNLKDATKNEPPVGVANGSITITSQIRSINANITDNYQANLRDYLTAGVPSGDKIAVAQIVGNIGRNSAASSLALSCVSNPAITEETIAAGGNVGTYPSNWVWKKVAPVYNPSVTLGTSPVAEVRRALSTGNCHCDFLGMYVEYVANKVSNTAGMAAEAEKALAATVTL